MGTQFGPVDRSLKRRRVDSGDESFGGPLSLEEYSLDVVPCCVAVVDSRLFLFSNRAFQEEIRKIPPKSGHAALNFASVPDSKKFSDLLLEALHSHRTVEGTVTLAGDGNGGPFEVSVRFSPHSSGRCVCVFKRRWLSCVDAHYDFLLTNVLTSIIEVPKEEDDFRWLVVSSAVTATMKPLGISFDPENGVLLASKQGWERADVVKFVQLLAGVRDDGSGVFDQIWKLPGGNDLFFRRRVQYWGPSPNGGQIYFMQGLDLTEIQRAKEQSEILKVFFDNAPCAMGVLQVQPGDRDAVQVLANAHTCRLFDKPDLADLIGKRWSELAGEETTTKWIAAFRQSQKESKPVNFEISAVIGGQERVMSVVCSYLRNQKFAYIAMDVTEYKRMEARLTRHHALLEEQVLARTKQLADALEVKSRFLAVMSHEIRTPLSGTMGTLGLLADTVLSPEQADLVHIGQVCGEQLLVLINDILDYSKMEEGKFPIESKQFSLVTVIEESMEIMSNAAEQQNVELVCDIARDFPDFVMGDALRVRQILVNLLSNAVKFSYSNSDVVVRASSQPSGDSRYEVSCSVSDNGIGISEEAQGQLFQPFSQADSSTTRKYGGSGLGLSISRRLAEMMGGRLWFESEPTRGSTFYFTLLVDKCPALERSLRHSLKSSTDALITALKVIIVDASPSNRKVLAARMQRWTWDVSVAGTVSEAAVYADQRPGEEQFDIALVDSKLSAEFDAHPSGIRKRVRQKVVAGYLRPPDCDDAYFIRKPIRPSMIYGFMCELYRQAQAAGTRDSSEHTVLPPAGSAKPDRRKEPLRGSILVAEDNSFNVRILLRLLKSIGDFQVETAVDGRQALNAVCAREFDVVLMDVMMPEMSGLEATRAIRNDPVVRQPYIIAATANAFADDRQDCLRSGMDDVVTKPFEKEVLTEAIRKGLRAIHERRKQ